MSKRAAVAIRQNADVVELNIVSLLDFQSEDGYPMQVEVKKYTKNESENFKVISATRDEIISFSVFLGTCHSFIQPVKHEIVPGQYVVATRISDELINLKFSTEKDLQEALFDPQIKSSISVNVSVSSTFAFEVLINQVLGREISEVPDLKIHQRQFASVA